MRTKLLLAFAVIFITLGEVHAIDISSSAWSDGHIVWTSTPTYDYDVNLASCVILTQWNSWDNYSDWLNAHTKAGLSIKIKKMLWEDQFNPVHGTEIGWLEWFLSTLP